MIPIKEISSEKFLELEKNISVDEIKEQIEVKGIVCVFNKQYIACSKKDNYILCMQINRVDYYRGPLVPFGFFEHSKAIKQGKREKSYKGLMVTCSRHEYIMIGPLTKFIIHSQNKKDKLFNGVKI